MKKLNLLVVCVVALATLSVGVSSCDGRSGNNKSSYLELKLTTPEEDAAKIVKMFKEDPQFEDTDEIMEYTKNMTYLYAAERGGDESRKFTQLVLEGIQQVTRERNKQHKLKQ
ncbi:hypothetical protein AGMMS4957_09600 [Bacteroidia bacterium]|nr:hypothetical protein AGMMS4957_09600 [Bacteroidia bacterium]